MSSILKEILETKLEEIEDLKSDRKAITLKAYEAKERPSFYKALALDPAPRLIAEVKKASPSKGVIREDFNPVAIAKSYERGGAVALSVLTDRKYFQGNIDFITGISHSVKIPLLRKDFIIDELQILEAKAAGASAVLLIAAALDPAKLAYLYKFARNLHLQVLLEVHDAEDVKILKKSGCQPRIVGINNRDLNTFEVDLKTTETVSKLLPYTPDVLVTESGISTFQDVQTLMQYGAKAFLVGESLMRQEDVESATRKLLGTA